MTARPDEHEEAAQAWLMRHIDGGCFGAHTGSVTDDDVSSLAAALRQAAAEGEAKGAENERARLVDIMRRAGARMAYHVADAIERTPAAKTAEAGTCGECHLGVIEGARGTLSLCPDSNGSGKARDGAGEHSVDVVGNGRRG